jgi:ABC-2 type transport system ATP-binding protein
MIISCRELEYAYGKQLTLKGVSFTVNEGCTGLLGPNGAGKSTLIKCLLGQLPQPPGRIEIFGHDVSSEPLSVRELSGYMPEGEALLPGFTGLEMTVICGRLCGLPKVEAVARAHQVLYYVGLGEERYREAQSYSTGMRQKLKLACALVHGPRLLVLDEPTSGLDPQGREQMLEIIRDLGQRGVSVFFSSHILKDLEGVCEQLVVLQGGELIFSGSREDFQRQEHSRLRVRLKSGARRLAEHLRRQGLNIESVEGESQLEIKLPAGASALLIWRSARELGLQIRGLSPATLEMEQAFARVLQSRTDGAEQP